MRKRRIVVMGYMASCPIAGVVWQHLHYIVGLQRLGHEVYYVEDSARYPYDPSALNVSEDCTRALKTLQSLADAFCLHGKWAYSARFRTPVEFFGLNASRVRQLYAEADAILNICGAQELHEEILKAEDRLIYIQSDPPVEQIKVAQGDPYICETLDHNRALFTFGENVPGNSFPVPLHGLRWLPTRQPVVIDFWKTEAAPEVGAIFTSLTNWSTRGRKDVTWNGETYLWSKSENFIKYSAAPEFFGETLELATDIRDISTAELFRSKGWRIRNPYVLSNDREVYRQYIRASRGEFTVSKDNVVRLKTGWFSDRSACYLAAGRPVITQETGFTRLYGGDKGLFAFSNLDEIREAAAAVRADYVMHSRAAFEIAVEFFEAKKVLASLLNRAGV
jgi:hypothetical protein